MTSGHGPEVSLAERLKALRHSGLSRALTQREVAAALGGDKPLSLALISSWETGKALPTEERLRELRPRLRDARRGQRRGRAGPSRPGAGAAGAARARRGGAGGRAGAGVGRERRRHVALPGRRRGLHHRQPAAGPRHRPHRLRGLPAPEPHLPAPLRGRRRAHRGVRPHPRLQPGHQGHVQDGPGPGGGRLEQARRGARRRLERGRAVVPPPGRPAGRVRRPQRGGRVRRLLPRDEPRPAAGLRPDVHARLPRTSRSWSTTSACSRAAPTRRTRRPRSRCARASSAAARSGSCGCSPTPSTARPTRPRWPSSTTTSARPAGVAAGPRPGRARQHGDAEPHPPLPAAGDRLAVRRPTLLDGALEGARPEI